MSSPTTSLYRSLVPAHGSVPDAVVSTFLGLAEEAHTESTWGDVYGTAMCWWAAAKLQPLVAAGQYEDAASCEEPEAESATKAAPAPDYWAWYLQLRDGRAATGPRLVRVC